MKCPNCDGTGQIPDNFQIPVWNGTGVLAHSTIAFVEKDAAGNNDEVQDIGINFGKFIKAHAHGCFHDGLKAELNRD